VLVQSRRDKSAAKRLLCKLLKRQRRVPRVMVTDKLGGKRVAQQAPMPGIEHHRHRGSAIGRKSAPVGIMARTGQVKCFTSARLAQHFLSACDPINNSFHLATIAADDADAGGYVGEAEHFPAFSIEAQKAQAFGLCPIIYISTDVKVTVLFVSPALYTPSSSKAMVRPDALIGSYPQRLIRVKRLNIFLS
jgi:hypothetical protein